MEGGRRRYGFKKKRETTKQIKKNKPKDGRSWLELKIRRNEFPRDMCVR
jgi:hypothetical protein